MINLTEIKRIRQKGKRLESLLRGCCLINMCGSRSLAVLALLLHSTSERAPKI